MRLAITRAVSSQIGRCELTYRDRDPIDVALAETQHEQYERCLISLGCSLLHLPEAPELPDSVFVEDTAVVLEELAVITRPGAESRRAEIQSIAQALRPHRQLAFIEPPGVLDGGDVLRLDRRLFVGLSRRSNQAAVDQVQRLLSDFGYTVIGVPVKGCLHLKSAVTQVAEDTLLLNRNWIDSAPFEPMRCIDVNSGEPFAANALMLGGSVVYPSAYPLTRSRLTAGGIEVWSVDVSELAKAEGGVTCCSLILSMEDARVYVS
jgi:dimethylargininase